MNEPTAAWGIVISSALPQDSRIGRWAMNSTMAARARQTVDDADGAAYADAVSEYAAPGVGRIAGRGRQAADRFFSRYFGSRLNSDLHQK
ncbi:hypothetical protein [Streptomyces sp. NPDC057284]|uniref:hypothetical protein n=1 Tax=Streptomyces sp. NPDC057284 TaxID=3346083 RepID=UPI00363EFEA8